MSEHTKGRLHQCSHSDKRLRDEGGEWVADTDTARRKQEECSANARRIAAAWNACEGMPTDDIEELAACHGVMTLTVYSDDMLAELNAARALLREVVDMVSSEEYNDTIRKADAYLDACDTPGEPT